MAISLTYRLLVLVLVGVLAPVAGARVAPRIFDGTPVQVPGFMGGVVGSTNTGGWQCTGVAISPNVLLTAAHCVVDETTNTYVDPSQLGVIFGQDDPFGAYASGTAVVDPVVDFKNPPQYGTYKNGVTTYDVALLQLRDPAPGTLSVIPPGRSDLAAPGTESLVMGWGLADDSDPNSLPSNLLVATMPIDPDATCSQSLLHYSPSLMLCAGDGVNAAPCQGDSGGPLIVLDPATSTDYEAGVVSYGDGCQLLDDDSVFADLTGPLGQYVLATSAELQQAANSGVQASSPSPAASYLTAAQARTAADEFAVRRWHWRITSTTCRRNTTTVLICRVNGTRRGRSYYTRLRITLKGGRTNINGAR
jgi:secreted trypsin-like serine protease